MQYSHKLFQNSSGEVLLESVLENYSYSVHMDWAKALIWYYSLFLRMNVFRLFLVARFTLLEGRFANVKAIQMIVK
jgi:hypothetical protein